MGNPAMVRRRKRWFDLSAPMTVLAAASITQEILLTESIIEDELEGAATLLRVVGGINVFADVGNPIIMFNFMAEDAAIVYGATSFDATNSEENLEKHGTLWTRLWTDHALSVIDTYIPVDIRTKRKLTQGFQVSLYATNRAAALNTAQFTYQLRLLVALP